MIFLIFFKRALRKKALPLLSFFVFLLSGLTIPVSLTAQDGLPSLHELKQLSVEELMDIEIISVSKQPEQFIGSASAIQVITHDDIKRSGATSLPDALRLASNLHVAQVNSYAWIISARGFNAFFSNKLLVLIDGRTVYTPLFGGVYWDVQHLSLEDIDRIEVVSGPGASLWGANAVNGIINIITKKADETQGLYASATAGTFLKNKVTARYGGKVGQNLYYRVYGQRFDHGATFQADDDKNPDQWGATHGGFRMDWYPDENNTVAVIGNLYGGSEETLPAESVFDGQNLTGRWVRRFSEKSNLAVQAYFDRTWRVDAPSGIQDELHTYDINFQHSFKPGSRHDVLWGAEYRFMQDDTENQPDAGFIPDDRNMQLFSGFIQDNIELKENDLYLTLGVKLERNDFSGFEVQPSGRVSWTPDRSYTFWAAVSRAVRAPSRVDVDYYVPARIVPPPAASIAGGPDFHSERVIAYELGFKLYPSGNFYISLATFFNQYSDLYSLEPLPGTLTYVVQNGSEGSSNGVELSGAYQPVEWWRLRGGYTYFYKNLQSKPGHVFDPSLLGNDPGHQALLQSNINLPGNFQLDLMGRYVSQLSFTETPAYFKLDAQITWLWKSLEFSIAGRNLTKKWHDEYGSALIPRSFYGKIAWRP